MYLVYLVYLGENNTNCNVTSLLLSQINSSSFVGYLGKTVKSGDVQFGNISIITRESEVARQN